MMKYREKFTMSAVMKLCVCVWGGFHGGLGGADRWTVGGGWGSLDSQWRVGFAGQSVVAGAGAEGSDPPQAGNCAGYRGGAWNCMAHAASFKWFRLRRVRGKTEVEGNG